MRDTSGVIPAVDAQDLPTPGAARPTAALARTLEHSLDRATAIGEDAEAERRRRQRLNSRDSPMGELLNRIYPV